MPGNALTRFPCPHCDRKLKAKPELTGALCRCPRCSATVTVPAVAVPLDPKPKGASEEQKALARKLAIAVDENVTAAELGVLIGKARQEKPHRKPTARQREFAEELGIAFDENIDRWELSRFIDQALEERDRKAAEEDSAAQAEEDRAAAVRDALEDAEPEDMINELCSRGQNAVLIVWETYDGRDHCEMSYTKNVTLQEANDLIKKYGLSLLTKEKEAELKRTEAELKRYE